MEKYIHVMISILSGKQRYV